MRAMWELARRQLGLITRAQALQLVTVAQLRTLLARGVLVRRRRGVYAVAGMPPTYEQAVLAAVLAAGGEDEAWAGQRTSAALHRLKVPPPEGIDIVTLPDVRVRLDGVVHHRNNLIVTTDVTRRRGVPTLSVARTLVDCIPWLPGRALASAVDDARRRGLLTIEDLEAAHASVDEGPRTGRRRVVPMRSVLAKRLAGLHAGGGDLELDVLEILVAGGLPRPVQQFRVVVGGRERFLDYAYPNALVYLEFLGFAEHGLIRSTFDDDADREAELALAGWLLIGVTSNTSPAALVDRVGRALDLRAA